MAVAAFLFFAGNMKRGVVVEGLWDDPALCLFMGLGV
jgi:hypothetical protein